MPVKSLLDLATFVCLKNVKQLDSVGDYLPYQTVRTILSRVESAYQLRQIELNSPQIEGETGELWLKIIERDFPLEFRSQSYKPQDPKKWYKVWEKYKKAHDKSIAESERQLMQAFSGLKEDKEKNTSRVVERKTLLNNGLLKGRTARPLRGGMSRSAAPAGKGLLQRARREAQEIARIHGSLSRPAPVGLRSATVTRAPSAMVDDYRRAAQPSLRAPATISEPPPAVVEHERRAQFISDSEDDDLDNGLFDDQDSALPQVATKSKIRPTIKQRALNASSRPAPESLKASLAKRKGNPVSATSPPKTQPHVSSSTTRTSNSVIPQSSSKASGSTATATKKRSGILSNRYRPSDKRPAVTKLPPATSPPPSLKSSRPAAPTDERPKIQHQPKAPVSLPRNQTSPPLSAVAGPSSPPPAPPLGSPPPVDQSDTSSRKRRAVDIFMRPKKKLK